MIWICTWITVQLNKLVSLSPSHNGSRFLVLGPQQVHSLWVMVDSLTDVVASKPRQLHCLARSVLGMSVRSSGPHDSRCDRHREMDRLITIDTKLEKLSDSPQLQQSRAFSNNSWSVCLPNSHRVGQLDISVSVINTSPDSQCVSRLIVSMKPLNP